MLVHELGHHATQAGRFGLAASWYAGPGRLAFRLILALAVLASGGRRPGRATWLVMAAGGAIAIVQTAQQRQWLSVAILSAVAPYFWTRWSVGPVSTPPTGTPPRSAPDQSWPAHCS